MIARRPVPSFVDQDENTVSTTESVGTHWVRNIIPILGKISSFKYKPQITATVTTTTAAASEQTNGRRNKHSNKQTNQ